MPFVVDANNLSSDAVSHSLTGCGESCADVFTVGSCADVFTVESVHGIGVAVVAQRLERRHLPLV